MYSLINLFEASKGKAKYDAEKKRVAKIKADPEKAAQYRARRAKVERDANARTKAKREADPEFNVEYLAKELKRQRRRKRNPAKKAHDRIMQFKNRERVNQDPVEIEKKRLHHIKHMAKAAGFPPDLVDQAVEFAKAKGRKIPYRTKKRKIASEMDQKRIDNLLKSFEKSNEIIDKWNN